MASQHPLGANYAVVCAEGFLALVEAIVGDAKLWDEQQQNFDLLLAREPHTREAIFDQIHGLPLFARDGQIFVVYYHVNDDKREIILLEAHSV
jgi:hypothetical protein